MSSQKPPCDFCDRRLQRHGRVALGHCSYKTCFELLRIASLIGDLMLSVIKFTFVVFTGLFRLSYLRIEVTEDAISIRDTPGDWLRIWHNGCKTHNQKLWSASRLWDDLALCLDNAIEWPRPNWSRLPKWEILRDILEISGMLLIR